MGEVSSFIQHHDEIWQRLPQCLHPLSLPGQPTESQTLTLVLTTVLFWKRRGKGKEEMKKKRGRREREGEGGEEGEGGGEEGNINRKLFLRAQGGLSSHKHKA